MYGFNNNRRKQTLFQVQQRMRQQKEDQACLEWMMKRRLVSIMQLPTKDQIYDNVSFKLGAFHKRFWENKSEGLIQSTLKAGQIVAMASNMKSITRQEDRFVKVCAYARDLRKYQSNRYEAWKQYIWIDLQAEERTLMETYVDQMTPPMPYKDESQNAYQLRQKATVLYACEKMNHGMLLVEIFQQIWAIQMHRKNKPQNVEQQTKDAQEMLVRINSKDKSLRGYLATRMGEEEWKQIEKLW